MRISNHLLSWIGIAALLIGPGLFHPTDGVAEPTPHRPRPRMLLANASCTLGENPPGEGYTRKYDYAMERCNTATTLTGGTWTAFSDAEAYLYLADGPSTVDVNAVDVKTAGGPDSALRMHLFEGLTSVGYGSGNASGISVGTAGSNPMNPFSFSFAGVSTQTQNTHAEGSNTQQLGLNPVKLSVSFVGRSFDCSSHETSPDAGFTNVSDDSAITDWPVIGYYSGLTGWGDTNSGTSIERVSLYLRRQSDGKFWSSGWYDDSDFCGLNEDRGWRVQETVLRISSLTNDPVIPGRKIWEYSKAGGLPIKSIGELVNGYYDLIVRVFDGNSHATVHGITVYVHDDPDTTAPAVTISSPIDDSLLTTLTSISGAALDNTGGEGFAQSPARVVVTLYRYLDQKWWNGQSWGNLVVRLPTTLSNVSGVSADWTSNFAFPTTWVESKYAIFAKAFDGANNASAAAAMNVWIPGVAPTVAITSPGHNSVMTSLTAMNGTASDNTGGSGIYNVQTFIRRPTDDHYWTGTSWSSTRTPMPSSYSSGSWSSTAGPPTTALTPGATYFASAVAMDHAQLTTSAAAEVRYATETIAPTVAITVPVNATPLSSLTSVYGTASDNSGGIGLKSVEVFIARGSDDYYWTGTTWSSTRVGKLATISGSNWTYSGALPGTLQPGVNYYVSAWAADHNLNISASANVMFQGN